MIYKLKYIITISFLILIYSCESDFEVSYSNEIQVVVEAVLTPNIKPVIKLNNISETNTTEKT